MTTQLENDFEALVLALELAITAPNEQKADECAAMAESLAEKFTVEQVKLAKELEQRKLGTLI